MYWSTSTGWNFVYYFQEIVTPDVLYEEVVEVEERLVLQQEKCRIKLQKPTVTGTTKEKVGRLQKTSLFE